MTDELMEPLETVTDMSSIVIPKRQRQLFAKQPLSELKDSIRKHGLLHPIHVNYRLKEDGDGGRDIRLISGERRLLSVRELAGEYISIVYGDSEIPEGFIPVICHYGLTDQQEKEIELDENLMRSDLTWQEKIAATAELHAFRQEQKPEQTYADTAKEIKKATAADGASEEELEPNKWEKSKVKRADLIAPYLTDESVAKAANENVAFKRVADLIKKEFMGALDRNTIVTEGMDSQHTLYHVDMLKFEPKKTEMGTFSVCITDPPYNVGLKNFGNAQDTQHDYVEDNAEELYIHTIKLASIMCKESAHLYLFCDIDMVPFIKEELEKQEWKVRRVPLTWSKGNRGHLPDGGVLGWRRTTEFIIYATRGAKTCNALVNDMINIHPDTNNFHGAQKPVALYETLLAQSALIGDKVLDLFAGSGVIFPAAEKLGMKATGLEMNEATVSMIEAERGIYRE